MMTLAQLDGGPKEIVLVGQAAGVVCARWNGAAVVACAP